MKLMMSIAGPFEVQSPIIPERSTEIYVSTGGVDGRFKVSNVEYKIVTHDIGAELQVLVTLSSA